MSRSKLNKRGGIGGDAISGTAGLIILTIITLVLVATVLNANLFGDGVVNWTETNESVNEQSRFTAGNMSGNMSAGIDNISAKIPTILLIVAVVILFGALVLLVAQSRRMGIGGGGTL